MTAWLITAAALALAAVMLVRAALAQRTAATLLHDAARTETDLSRAAAHRALANAALAQGALGAISQTLAGDAITVGTVPASLSAAFGGEGPLADAFARLTAGTPFRQPLADDGTVVSGVFHDGRPTLFVEGARRSKALEGAADDLGQRLTALMVSAPHPAWVEVPEGERIWANAAYERATAAPTHALAAAPEPLLDANAAARLAADREGPLDTRVATVVHGERRLLDIAAHRTKGTLAALAVDVTEINNTLSSQARALESHAATLDRLATAIAIYGPDRRLAFHNAAFANLFSLPTNFLEQMPPEERVLDRLRAERRLPESADFKAFKRDQLKGYETRESFERWWHLPDGQALRVIANPGADGGVTYIYENVTEQLALERRFNALSRAQGETIDNLGEGIASFGPDGLLRLANPAFWSLTGADKAAVGAHVRTIGTSAPEETHGVWGVLMGKVTGFTDHRTAQKGRVERMGGRVLDYAFTPLPDGSTLAMFADVTDSVNVARVLVERNNALEAADKLKNDFIQHVSYELRSPLNTILGFTQMLIRPEFGALNARQREYADYIATSSEALLVIIDGILDLATIDAGIMELSIGPVDVEASVQHALDGLKDRVAEADLAIDLAIAPNAKIFEGDAQRVRQVLFNLLSNAVSHSPPGGAITITSRFDGGAVAISVRDRGPGISEAKTEAVFNRFMTAGANGRRGGVGLGLSLVKSFVELHGGSVAVAPVEGAGAEIVVRFPRQATDRLVRDAA